MPLAAIFSVFFSEQDGLQVKKMAEKALQSPGTLKSAIVNLQSLGGTPRYCRLELVAYPLQSSGNEVGFLALGEDLTDFINQKIQFEKLAERNALQNQSLLNFAYSVSHNLRSHVANLMSFYELREAQLISDGEAGDFDKLVKENLERLDKTIHDLNNIIFSHPENNRKKEEFCVNESIAVVLNSISNQINENHATIINTIRSNSMLKSVQAYFESIFLNLMTNALKYKHPQRDPIIKISFYSTGDFKVLEVKDNGLGIDLIRYGDKIFNLFRTFHGNPDARGMGLYLSRIQAESLGGSIRVVSVPDKGSTFKVFFNEGN